MLHGRNGTGKTTVLDALEIGLCGRVLGPEATLVFAQPRLRQGAAEGGVRVHARGGLSWQQTIGRGRRGIPSLVLGGPPPLARVAVRFGRDGGRLPHLPAERPRSVVRNGSAAGRRAAAAALGCIRGTVPPDDAPLSARPSGAETQLLGIFLGLAGVLLAHYGAARDPLAQSAVCLARRHRGPSPPAHPAAGRPRAEPRIPPYAVHREHAQRPSC